MSNDPRFSKLPTWAREAIKQLEKRADPNNEDLRRANKQAEQAVERRNVLQARCAAMLEIMQAAAKGGHELATAFVEKVLANWQTDGECKSE